MSWVTTRKGFPKLTLIKEVQTHPRQVKIFTNLTRHQADTLILRPAKRSQVVALDFETRGLDPLHPDSALIGLGLAWDTGVVYVDLVSTPEYVTKYLLTKLCDLPLIAHNVMFDGSWIRHFLGRHPNWVTCTFALYKFLATEGFPGQSWSLKTAQMQCLGWSETNEGELDSWLISNGWIKGVPWAARDDMSDEELAAVREKVQVAILKEKKLRPNKGEMWRAPYHVLGRYCGLDADSTYQLFTKVLEPAASQFNLEEFNVYVMNLIELLIEQRLRGMELDVPALQAHQRDLQTTRDMLSDLIFQLIPREIEEWNQMKVAKVLAKEPPKFRKAKDPGPEPAKYRQPKPEPAKYTKKGRISKTWKVWARKEGARLASPTAAWSRWRERSDLVASPPVSKVWLTWKSKYDKTVATNHFNLDAGAQLCWLLYEKLFKVEELVPFENSRRRGSFQLTTPTSTCELEYTKTGALPTDGVALRWMGELGQLINDYKATVKELGYVNKYLELRHGATLHPNWIAPRALTGRLAGSTPNIQQAPMSWALLRCLRARPGFKIVNSDHTALENVILAEFSRDVSLLKIYGPGAKPDDAYLNAGAYLPVIGPKIRAAGYDPENPTEEGIASAKKLCKKERGIAKTIVLASNYGAGAGKIFKTLKLAGVAITFSECEDMLKAYWELRAGVVRYRHRLEAEWRRNGGYFITGFGRPMAVAPDLKKDLVNRDCQSGGHDWHMLFVFELKKLLDSSEEMFGQQIEAYPWIVDWHDDTQWEVREDQVEQFKHLLELAYERANAVFKDRWICEISGGPAISVHLAQAKELGK